MLESVLKEKGFEFVAVLENYEEERINLHVRKMQLKLSYFPYRTLLFI